MKIEIDSSDVKTVTGTNARGPWEIRTQVGYVDQGKRYPAEIKLRLKDGKSAYAPGVYDVDLAASSYVSKYGALALSEELVLIPAAPRAVGKASA
jgi:hypothetical protein